MTIIPPGICIWRPLFVFAPVLILFTVALIWNVSVTPSAIVTFWRFSNLNHGTGSSENHVRNEGALPVREILAHCASTVPSALTRDTLEIKSSRLVPV